MSPEGRMAWSNARAPRRFRDNERKVLGIHDVRGNVFEWKDLATACARN